MNAETEGISEKDRARLLPSLSTRAQLDEAERIHVHAARVWAMRKQGLGREGLMSEAFSRELHRRMFSRIWRDAGSYRVTAGPGWEPGRIRDGVALFFDDAEGWLRYSTYSVDEAAVRLHHRLFAIRPWEDGNGRHARLVADIVVAAHGERPLTWGAGSPASAPSLYAQGRRAADAGDFAPLVALARA